MNGRFRGALANLRADSLDPWVVSSSSIASSQSSSTPGEPAETEGEETTAERCEDELFLPPPLPRFRGRGEGEATPAE